MDLDLNSDSLSSCVTSSCSADSEDDDLCSIDGANLNENLERSYNLEWDRNGNDDVDESESGRVSHVSCSVDESDDEDEVYLVSLPLLASAYLLI
jgi:hypothetical protein